VSTPSFLQPVAREIQTGGSQMALLMSPGAPCGTPPVYPGHPPHQAGHSRGGSDPGSEGGIQGLWYPVCGVSPVRRRGIWIPRGL